MCIKMRFVNGARKKKSVLCAGFAALLLIGCGGGGKAVAGDYKLKVNVNPANGGSISISPNRESYNEWMDVEVTATANKGYIFTGWSGDATDKSRSVTIKMSGNKNKKLTANFKAVSVSAFTDSRDGKKYKTVTIGSQTWMGENLNHETVNSKCHDNNASNCTKYGRLYTWSAALTACPAGWHLPSDAEWTTLENAVGGENTAGVKLKSTSGWSNNGDGTDDVGFSALPGGNGGGRHFFNDAIYDITGYTGYWWTATEDNNNGAVFLTMRNHLGSVSKYRDIKTLMFSVRCVEGIVEQHGAKKDPDKAIAEYTQAIRLNPKDADNYSGRGDAYFAKKDYDKAIADYTQAIRLDSKDGSNYFSRATAYSIKEDYDKAIADYTQAIKLDPEEALYYDSRGDAYLEKKDYGKALADYNKAIKLEPEEADYYISRGDAYLEKKDYDKAIADYTQAIKLDPENANYYRDEWGTNLELEDYDGAISAYTSAIKLESEYAGYYISRGWAYHEKKDYDKAIADYTQAIRLEPKDAGTYNARCWTYGNKGEYDKAIADCNQAIRLDPEDANTYHSRGFAYLGKKDYNKAISDFEAALRIDPDLQEAKDDLEKAKKLKGGR